MTDEEIEKTIQCCAALPNCGKCPLKNTDGTAAGDKDLLISQSLDYINRLKEQLYQTEQKLAECENGYQATLDLERRMRADDKEEIRKETAKEILQAMINENWAGNVYFIERFARELAKQYGIEVDE